MSGERRRVRRFFMVCAGSGITPILQVLRAMSADPHDPTDCTLLNGNRAEQDILCRAQLDQLIGPSGSRCRAQHTLSHPSPTWTERRGRIDGAMIEAEIRPRDKEGGDMVLICGPKGLERNSQTFS